jgi:hypothetical protein
MKPARPRKLFSFARETEINHVDKMTGDPAERELLYPVIDAFIEIIQTETLTSENLLPFTG